MKIELPLQKRLVHTCHIPIRWGDMDAMGHVNNAVYFRYMESARVDWLQRAGCAPAPDGTGPVIVNAFCNFQRQLQYPGDVVVQLYVSDAARATFETWVTMARADAPDTVCAQGGATVIWVDIRAQKAVSLPDWVRALVTA